MFHLMIASLTDIPVTTEPADDLPQSLELFHSIFQNAVEGIFQSTPDGRYLLVNPALARMYGYASPAEMITAVADISGTIYVDPKVRDEFKRLMARDGEVRGLEYQVQRKDGTTFWISEHARTVAPETRVLFTSGYTDRSVISSGALNPGTRFLQKPYPLTTLVHQVRTMLDN